MRKHLGKGYKNGRNLHLLKYKMKFKIHALIRKTLFDDVKATNTYRILADESAYILGMSNYQ